MSLIELIVGIVVLTIGMLGLAAVSTVVLKQMHGGARQTIAATIAQTRFESMEGMPCSYVTSGSGTTRGMNETWSVSTLGARARSVRDTVSYVNMRGLLSKVGISTVVSCVP